ncbi:MAG: STAS domain-containing protein [Chitinivibrionales bacterium]|nr:STAS domain-containing protein [Chitinivibrionales bacterium]
MTQSIHTKTIPLDGVIKGKRSIELGKLLESHGGGLFKKIIVDMEEVSFIDSCGVGALLYYNGVFQKEGIELILAVPDNWLKEFITDSRLEEVITVIPANRTPS